MIIFWWTLYIWCGFCGLVVVPGSLIAVLWFVWIAREIPNDPTEW